jgi:hypothetical protein
MLTTAELRWFWRGHCPKHLYDWFFHHGNAPGGGQSRTDRYLPQLNQPEVSLKTRGRNEGLEIKGLVARRAWPLDAIAEEVEIWCKWSCQIPHLSLADAIPIAKTRWLRQFDTSNSVPLEIPLRPDETPRAGYSVPVQGCNAELTEVNSTNFSQSWWTLGFEAFGDLEALPLNLMRAIAAEESNLADIAASGELLSYPAWLSARLSEKAAHH